MANIQKSSLGTDMVSIRKAQKMFTFLNTWFWVAGSVWEGLGGMGHGTWEDLLEMCHQRQGFEMSNAYAIPS